MSPYLHGATNNGANLTFTVCLSGIVEILYSVLREAKSRHKENFSTKRERRAGAEKHKLRLMFHGLRHLDPLVHPVLCFFDPWIIQTLIRASSESLSQRINIDKKFHCEIEANTIRTRRRSLFTVLEDEEEDISGRPWHRHRLRSTLLAPIVSFRCVNSINRESAYFGTKCLCNKNVKH